MGKAVITVVLTILSYNLTKWSPCMLHVKIWFGHFSDVTLTLAKEERSFLFLN